MSDRVVNEAMNLTLRLMELLDSSSKEFSPLSTNEIMQIIECARKNRILFSCIEAINQRGLSDKFSETYREQLDEYAVMLEAVCRLGAHLDGEQINYAMFKTIRPYRSTTVDLDVLIFGPPHEYFRAIGVAKKAGYKLVVQGPMSTTFRDPVIGIGIDLYKEIAVSNVIYVNKETLTNNVIKMKLPGSQTIKMLKPEADLACIIAHSIIKEQMYTLSEYYSFTNYLEGMNMENFLKIVKGNNIVVPARVHASITAFLYRVVHKTTPVKLQVVLDALGEDDLERTTLIKTKVKLPHKYHIFTIFKALLEISKGSKTQKTIVAQIYRMSEYDFAVDFLKKLRNHVFRESY